MGAGAPAGAGGKRRQRRYAEFPRPRPDAAEIRSAGRSHRSDRGHRGAAHPVSLARTADGHIAGIGQGDSPFRSERSAGYEVRPTGNAVNLEQEMMKVAANQMDYQAVAALYSRSLGLLKTALGKG